MKKIFLIDSTNRNNDTKAIEGLKKAISLNPNNEPKNMVILAPQISSFHNTDLGQIIDNLNVSGLTASRLERHKEVKIGATQVEAVSSSKITKSIGSQSVDILLAYCPTKNDMQEIANLPNVNDVVVIPWQADEEQYIKQTWDVELV